MSSGPAIWTMKGTIASATGEPSSGTRARLYTAHLRSARAGGADVLDRRAVRTNEQDGRPSQNGLRNAAEDETAKPAPAMRAHDDQVDATNACRLDDRVAGGAVPHRRFHLGHAGGASPLGNPLQIRFGLTYDRQRVPRPRDLLEQRQQVLHHPELAVVEQQQWRRAASHAHGIGERVDTRQDLLACLRREQHPGVRHHVLLAPRGSVGDRCITIAKRAVSEITSFRRVEAANAPRTAGQWAQPLGRWCLTWGGGAPPQPKQMLPNTSILNVHGVAALMQPCGRRPKRLAGGGTDACIDAVDGDDGHEEGNG